MRSPLYLSTALFGLAALSGVPNAADLPSVPSAGDAPASAAVEPVVDWTGVYAGVHAGYLWGELDSGGAGTPPGSSIDLDGGLLGAQAGGLIQRGTFVFGAEIDAAIVNADGRYNYCCNGQEGISADLEWLATLRAVAGLARGPVFVYGTGGFAFAGLDIHDYNFSSHRKYDETLTGWAAGIGGSVRLSEHVSVNGQYLYVDLGDFNVDPEWWGPSYKYSMTGHTARIAVNIHR